MLTALKDDPEAFLQRARSILETDTGPVGPSQALSLATVVSYSGDVDLTWRLLRKSIETWGSNAVHIWKPIYRDIRQLDDFKDFLRGAGYVELWQTYGWPDLCRPLAQTDDDFVCD